MKKKFWKTSTEVNLCKRGPGWLHFESSKCHHICNKINYTRLKTKTTEQKTGQFRNKSTLWQHSKKPWQIQQSEQRAETSKQNANSCREDYRSYFDNIINDMASAEAVGNHREVRRLIKHLVAKQLFRQPCLPKTYIVTLSCQPSNSSAPGTNSQNQVVINSQ